MADDRSIFDEPHHHSLELLAARALSEGNIATAFRLADRRCRIPPTPEPHCYILRGEAACQMGATAVAIADIAKALEIAPDDVLANRRMLTWSKQPQQKMRAALALVGQETNLGSLRQAINVLHKSGKRNLAKVKILADAIEGWAVWEGDAPLTISVTDGANSVGTIVEPDAFHPLAEYGCAADFIVERTKSTVSQSIVLSTAGIVFYSTRTAGNETKSKIPVRRPRARHPRGQGASVVVPVYADYEATRICLESLLDELKSSSHHAIIVDDATPDPQIAKFLTDLGARPNVEVLINTRNLGFIASVNRALEHIEQGDVVLLNSDTLVPKGFINRLSAAARSSPDIGTVTPLSNNGEFTSFPMPYRSNPLCSRQDINRIDAIAARVNADKTVDVPSGIGFCLYLTRACLNAVGPLSEDFDSGYLEDTDFCLRARERGFRSVCAPSVYVGHAGSKSFGQEKRSLVVRNARVLEQRFPRHSSECEAFMIADPLQSSRQAIEREAAAITCRPRLLITGTGTLGAVARWRARALASEPNPVMILEARYQVDGATVKIFDAAGGMPQSLQLNLCSSSERDVLVDFMQSMQPSRIEFLDPANVPLLLVDLLLSLNVPYDILIADAGLLGPRNKQGIAATAGFISADDTIGRRERPLGSEAEPDDGDWADRWREIAQGAQRILAPCPQAAALAAGILPGRAIDQISKFTRGKISRAKRKPRKAATHHLGLVPVRSCAREQWLMTEIARRLSRMLPTVSITVVGATLDDIGLMHRSNAFVTGTVHPDEFEREVDSLGLGHLFISTTEPLFGHPILSVAHSSHLPTGYFDWSAGRIKPRRRDLSIDPRASLDDIVGALCRWMRNS